MGEQDWQQIVRRMTEISDAPLFIDYSPNLTMIEIRAKARAEADLFTPKENK